MTSIVISVNLLDAVFCSFILSSLSFPIILSLIASLDCFQCQSPIVVAIDVTGSMGNWSKIIYDKLPVMSTKP